MKQADKNFLDDVYDTLMKNTQYKVRDFTKYKDVYVDLDNGFIFSCFIKKCRKEN